MAMRGRWQQRSSGGGGGGGIPVGGRRRKKGGEKREEGGGKDGGGDTITISAGATGTTQCGFLVSHLRTSFVFMC